MKIDVSRPQFSNPVSVALPQALDPAADTQAVHALRATRKRQHT